MKELENSLKEYIKSAKVAMTSGAYEKAYDLVLHAAQSSLLLAKGSAGALRAKHMATYQSLKTMLIQLEKKKTSSTTNFDSYNQTQPVHTLSPGSNQDITVKENKKTDNEQSGNGGAYKKDNRVNKDSLSPQWLSDYIGQPQAVTAVRDLIRAALLKNSAMPHLILYGSHGLGKTTFSKIIANEMRVGFTEINVSKITPTEMIAILKKIQPKDIIFIDEIHTLPLVVAESILYSAMQDGRITYTEGKGKFARTETFTLPPFTLIGATTEIGKLSKPFTQRAITIRLEEYTDEVLSGIIANSFHKLGMKINFDNALYIAKRCRNNPRIANSMVKRISDKALVRYATINNLNTYGSLNSVEAIRKLNIDITEKVIDEFFIENGIDEHGLENGDRELLKMIINRYNGGPVGLDTLARAMNESNNVISQKYEAYLIKKGLLKIEPAGRMVMANAYRVLGLPVPKNLLEEDADSATKEKSEERNSSKYEKRSLIASHVPEELKCQKIEDLIVYPENVQIIDESLDVLFPDVEKPYEEETKHRCELEIDFDDFKRTLICDSFLESRFARCMASVGYLKDIKAQTLEIPYISQELANRRYFPDFVIKDYRGRIAVIEMKNFDMMSYHLNIDKYEHLKRFCESKGYGYAEIMKEYNADSYVSVEMLIRAPINIQLQQYIVDTIEKNGVETGEGLFTGKDFENYIARYGDVKKEEVYTILLNNRRLKNTDRTGTNFRIIMN